MKRSIRRLTPLGLAFVSLLAFAVPALADDQRFTQPRIYDATLGTSDVATADFNGDGILDLVTANRFENDIPDEGGDISYIPGNADGTFGATTEIDSTGGTPDLPLVGTATDVAAADLDGDGDQDLAISDEDPDNDNSTNDAALVTLLNDGSGNFERRDVEKYTNGISPVEVVVGNFDGEGNLEVAIANAGVGNQFGDTSLVGVNGTVTIFRNSGGGNFTEDPVALTPAGGESVQSLDVGDFNEDNEPDLIVALDDPTSTNDNARVFEGVPGAGNRNFTAEALVPVGAAPKHVIVADFDEDNDRDIATANNGSDDISVALGNGNGTFDTATQYDTQEGPYAVTVADFNIDGTPDLAAANSFNKEGVGPDGDEGTVSVLQGVQTSSGVSTGNFSPQRAHDTADGPVGIVSGTFGQGIDNLPDIATANFGTDGPDKEDGSAAVLLGKFQCNDGADNDADNKTDSPSDPGCESTTDNTESPDPPNYSINDVTVTEGDSGTVNAVFTVTRAGSNIATQASSVQFSTADFTATQPADYAQNSGTLDFAAGETTETVTVVVQGDTKNEPNETFEVNLSNPSTGSVIVDGKGIGTISNDDPVPAQCGDEVDNDGDGKTDFPDDLGCDDASDNTESPDQPRFSISNATVTEGNAGTVEAEFTVTRAGDSSAAASVDYDTQNNTAVAPGDYQQESGTINFAAGNASETITITVNGDLADEDNERFRVVLSNPSAGTGISDGTGVGTITDDDLPEADLELSLSDNPDPVRVGRKLTYTITVTNDGPNTAGDVRIENTIPRGVTYLDGDSSDGCSPNGRDIICTYGEMTSGETDTRKVVVRVNRDGILTDTARIFDKQATDPDSSNDSDTETTRARN